MALCDKIQKLGAATALLNETKEARDALASVKNARLSALVAKWVSLLGVADLTKTTADAIKAKLGVLTDAECAELLKTLRALEAFQKSISDALANGDLYSG